MEPREPLDWTLKFADFLADVGRAVVLTRNQGLEQMAARISEVTSVIHQATDIDTFLRQLPVGVIIAEAPGGRIVEVTEPASRLWSGAQRHADSVDDYSRVFAGYRPNGRQYAADEWPLARAVQHGEVVQDEEIEFRFASGERRIMQVSAVPLRDETGEYTRAVALFHDVTEQRHEERRREFLMALADELRILDDPVAVMETASVSTGEHLGVTSASYAEVDARMRYALVHAEYRNGRVAPSGKYHLEDFGGALIERIRSGETITVEDIAADPLTAAEVFEGWNIRSLIAAPIVRQGRLISIFTVMHSAPRRWTRSDTALVQQVAERTWHAVEATRVQTELRQSREWLSLALRSGSAAIWEWDLRTGEIHWSEEHGPLLGVPALRRSLTFGRWLALVHPEDRAAAKNASRTVAAMRGEGDVEFEYRLNSAESRWITMRGRVITDARGYPCRVVGVASDTTDRKVDELQREELLQQARLASEAKSHFIGVISHEFRTPLTAIIGYTDLLSSGISGALSPVQDRQLERIRASAWHLTQMVDEILTFSRIEAGRETVQFEDVEVCFVARECASLITPTAAAKGLGLVCELPDEDFTARCDGGKLRQILLNLLGNAVKFTDKGGIVLRVRKHDDVVEMAVQDTGVGIPAENLERVFERFWQSNDEGSRVVSGAGLGLTVSRHLAGLLGGTLEVESEVGSGSTFRLCLPLKRLSEGMLTEL
jgi:signal transduction histidine kinase